MLTFIILAMAVIGFVATDVYLPSLPAIVQELTTTQANVQLTLSLYLFTFGGGQIFFGPLSEKIGRKKVALWGLAILIAGSIICAFSPNIWVLIFGRCVEGLGVSGAASVMRVILRDVYSGDELSRKGSYISVGTAFAMSAAPAIGGYIQHYLGWRFNFGFIILYTLFVFLLVACLLRETHKNFDPHAFKISNLLSRYWYLLKNPIFIGYTGCTSLTFGGLAAYLAVAPFLFQNVVGLTPVAFGWLAIFISLGLAAGGFANSVGIRKLGRHQILKIGTILQIVSGMAMALPAFWGVIDIPFIMIPMLIYMVGAGFAFTNSFAGAFHFFPKMAGFVGALYGCFQIVGGTVSAAIMAIFHTQNQTPLALFLIFVGFANFFFQKLGHQFTLKNEKSG